MNSVFSILDENIKIINDSIPIKPDISADIASKDLFKLIDLITDFFINFQITEPQNIKLFSLFLPIQVQCFSVFNSQGIFSNYEFSHFWALFSKEFLKTTNSLVKIDLSKYIFLINENILPFLQAKNIGESVNTLVSQTIPHFTSLLSEISSVDVTLSMITSALNEFEKMKTKYYSAIDFLNLNGYTIIIPQNHINLLLEIEYSLSFYNHLLQVREIIKQLSDSNTIFTIKPIHNIDEIRIFSEKCIQFLILEIKGLINYTTESQIPNFFQVCTQLNELIASSHLFMNQHIIEIWNKIIPSISNLSIELDENSELENFSVIFESQSTNSSYNFTVDKIRSLINQGIPLDFRNSYILFIHLHELLKMCDDSTVIPYIEILISSATARLLYSKLLYDQQNMSDIFLLLDKEPSDIEAISYLKSCILKLINIGFFPSPKNSLQLRIVIGLCDSIVKSKEIEWIKYIPTSEMMLSMISFDNQVTSEIKNFLSISEIATTFVDHLFIDEIDDSVLANIYKFAERQIELSKQIKPHLFNFSVIYEIFPLINEIHKKYGQVDRKIRIDAENISKSESTYIQFQKVVNNGLFSKEEEELIAKKIISFLIFLLYEPEEDESFLDSFFITMSSYFYVPHCTELLSDCYMAFQCFDSWRTSNQDELNEVFDSLLTTFNSFLGGSSLSQLDQLKTLEASFKEKIDRIEPKWEKEFSVNFTNIEKYTVIGPMMCTITKMASSNERTFQLSQNDVIRIIAQVNHARLIHSCLSKIVQLEGAAFNAEDLIDLIERIDKLKGFNTLLDFANTNVDEIIDLFARLEIVNPKFVLDYFTNVYHFLSEQIETSSLLYFSNAPKDLKEVLSLLANFSTSNDHFKLREAIEILTNLISPNNSSGLGNSSVSYDLSMFKSTINIFLEKANAILCLIQMKLYMRPPNLSKHQTADASQGLKENEETKPESIFDPIIHQLTLLHHERGPPPPNPNPVETQLQLQNQNQDQSSIEKMHEKLNSIKSNKFDDHFNILKNTDPEDYVNTELEQLTTIHKRLSKKLLSFQTFHYDNERQHLQSDSNLKKLENELTQIEQQNEQKRSELSDLSDQYDRLLQERDQQFQCIQSEASEEHNRMSIMQLIINNDLDLSSFEQHVVDPQIVFLHDQLRDATTANTRLTKELRNRKFRIEKPPIPSEAMSEVLKETPQHRNWLSNEATNVMSLRGTLKLLQKQREDLFKELINERISYTQQKMTVLTSKSGKKTNLAGFETIDAGKQSDTVIEYVAELDKIAKSAEYRKDFAAIQEEFAFMADKLFFTLEEEIKEIKNEIKLKKKYGDNLKTVQMKNLQDLLKMGMMPNNIH